MTQLLTFLIPGSFHFRRRQSVIASLYFALISIGYLAGFFPGLFAHVLYLFIFYRKSLKLLVNAEDKRQVLQNLDRQRIEQESSASALQGRLDLITQRLGVAEHLEEIIATRRSEEARLQEIEERIRERLNVLNLVEEIGSLREEIAETRRIESDISASVEKLRREARQLEEELLLQSYGFYETKYSFPDSKAYQDRLKTIRDRQKQLLKEKRAATFSTSWSVQGSEKKGKKMMKDYSTLVLRAFNGECDAAVSKVRYNNVVTMEKRIHSSYTRLNKQGKRI
ncbi:MAG: DUF4041 domain-containing protein [Geitlerinemataceae cyanobacterium]